MCCGGESKDVRADLVPASERSCTDVLFLLFFLASFGGVVFVYEDARSKGADARRILKPTDFEGRLCGSTGLGGRDLAAWPDPIGAPLFRVCVADCNETEDATRFVYPTPSVNFIGLYCLPVPFTTETLLDTGAVVNDTVGTPEVFSDAKEAAQRAMADIEVTLEIIAASPAVAVVVAFLWLFLVRLAAGFVIWSSVLLTAAGAGFLGYTLLEQAEEYESGTAEVDDNRAKYARITGYVFIGLAALFLVMVFALRKRIRIAIEVIKEASRAVVDMPCVMCVPLMPTVLVVGYFALWLYIAITIFSVGDLSREPVPDTITGDGGLVVGLINPDYDGAAWVASSDANYTVFVPDEEQKYPFAYHFFHLLYFSAFCIYLAYSVIAGAVAEWYFTPYTMDGDKPRGSGVDQLSNRAVLNSWARTVRFHLGTISVGALIIAVIRFIRALLVYLEEKLTPEEGEPNRLVKCIFCVLHCFFCLLECCCDKINKNAFIWMAIWGDNFGTSACASFALVWRNLLRAAVLEMVGEYLMFLGKVMIAFATTGAAAFYMTQDESINSQISSVIVPSVIIFVVAYAVAGLFMVVFETTVDTTFMCFLVDEENNHPNLCASKDLSAVVDGLQAENRAAAMRRVRKSNPDRWPDGQAPRGLEGAPNRQNTTGTAQGGVQMGQVH